MRDRTAEDGATQGVAGLAPGSPLGMVVGGSLSEGVEVKLDGNVSVEEVPVGSYATIQGESRRFFGMVSEVRLAGTDARMRTAPPDVSDPFVAQVLSGTVAYGSITVRPRLLLPSVAGVGGEIAPARTVPAHFSRAHKSSEADVAQVFGEEDARHFVVGTPLDMETKVCLDLTRLVQRSNGVFGKSGTGKSFLTRLLLIGMLQKTDAATLVFDMHSEYGWQGGDTERGRQVKSLKQLFGSRVAVFTLDEEHSRRRRVPYDEVVALGLEEVEPEDIEVLARTLGLTDAGAQAVHKLPRHLGREWLRAFLDIESSEALGELADRLGEHPQTVSALRRRLERLRRMPFLTTGPAVDSLQKILEHLGRGDHVVLEFGKYGSSLDAYMLVANILTRRIHARYVQLVEEATGGVGDPPKNLVIVVEEAHRFLSPQVASQTIFGTIAREMRKYNVTLLVVDQRPSAIDSEVMSQIGTKLCCLLDDERDVDAVLAGTGGSRELRAVLAGLESRQQALIFGDAVPIPVAIRTREYGSEASYDALTRAPGLRRTQAAAAAPAEDDDDLFG